MSNYSSEYSNFFEANYPFSIKPERLINEADLRGIHRDYYGPNPWLNITESTPYDQTKGLAAGPFGSPNRFYPGPNESNLNGLYFFNH